MKKKLLVGLAIIMAIGVTGIGMSGCAAGADKNSASADKYTAGEESEQKQYIYGKVESIVGNEVEFQLAKDPGVDINGEEKDDEAGKKGDKKVEQAAMTGEAMAADENKVSVGEIDKNEPLVDLELTEEKKTISIPTGVNVNILSGKSGSGLSAIKEGTYLRIAVDDNKAQNPNILAVDIIS